MSRPGPENQLSQEKEQGTTTSPRAERIQSNAGAPGC